jgi:hypothetical protein
MVGRGRGRGGASGKGSEFDLVGGDEPVGAVSCGLKKRDAVIVMGGRVRGRAAAASTGGRRELDVVIDGSVAGAGEPSAADHQWSGGRGSDAAGSWDSWREPEIGGGSGGGMIVDGHARVHPHGRGRGQGSVTDASAPLEPSQNNGNNSVVQPNGRGVRISGTGAPQPPPPHSRGGRGMHS